MPLIRYRTGDIARFLPKSCSCSDVFRRMDYVRGRLSENLSFKDGSFISIGMLDEIMFRIDNVLDYRAVIKEGEKIILSLSVKPVNKEIPVKFIDIENLIKKDKYLDPVIKNNNIFLEFTGIIDNVEVSNGMKKRKLLCKRS